MFIVSKQSIETRFNDPPSSFIFSNQLNSHKMTIIKHDMGAEYSPNVVVSNPSSSAETKARCALELKHTTNTTMSRNCCIIFGLFKHCNFIIFSEFGLLFTLIIFSQPDDITRIRNARAQMREICQGDSFNCVKCCR